MKTRLLIMLLVAGYLVAALPGPANAMTFNPQIGVNAAKLSNDPQNGEHKARTGWQVGANFRFNSEKFYYQPGLFYHQAGTELQTTDDITNTDTTFQNQVHSIQIPFVIGFNVIDGGTMDLRL